MDLRTRNTWRTAAASPGDEVAQERLAIMVRRQFVEPEDAFQADIYPGGRLDLVLNWEMDYSKIAVQTKEGGGLVSATSMFGTNWVHVRIWYPSFEDVLKDLCTEDIRISVSTHYDTVGDVIESLEGRYAGATIVSSAVALIDPEGYSHMGGIAKPKRSGLADPQKLKDAAVISERSTRHRGWGDSSWVA